MPFTEVMHKFKHGDLHSGSKSGKKVTDRKQAIAIMMSEKKKADSGDSEYKPVGPSENVANKITSGKKKKKSLFGT